MKALISISMLIISSSAFPGECTSKGFFTSFPYEELYLHEMLELKKEDYVGLIKAVQTGSRAFSSVDYAIEDDVLRIHLPHGGEFQFYTLRKSESGCVGVYISYWGKQSAFAFYDISEDGIAAREHINLSQSDLYENDLLLPKDRFSERDNDRLVISPYAKGVFVADRGEWYSKKWENRTAAYSITFRWNGEEFVKHIEVVEQ